MYDDAEGHLKDQGLEVVVIPYRPSPPSKPPLHSPKRGRQPDVMSPASDESKTCETDDINIGTTDQPPSPPPPRQSLFTPRSQSVVAEAMEQNVVGTPPSTSKLIEKSTSSIEETKKKSEHKQQGEGVNNKLKKVPARSQSVGPSTTNYTSTKTTAKERANTNNIPNNNNTSPRIRSKSTPSKTTSSSKKKKQHRNPNEKMGFYQMAKLGYQELCNAIVRPPRSNYPLSALGPEEFMFCDTKFIRKDFGVVNERGLLLECSIWKRAREFDDDDDDDDDDEEGEGYLNQNLNGVLDEQHEEENNGSDTSNSKDEQNKKEHGEIILNVDDWDESKERGQMYLHVPESFDASTASSEWNEVDDDDDESVTSELIQKADSILNNSDEDDDDDNVHELPQDEGFLQFTAQGIRNLKLAHQNSESTAHIYYQGSTKTRKRRRDPVVIYLHGNSSGRTEVIPQLAHLLSLGVSVVAFDFAGSGKSEGEFVSLGYYEREDLHTVIKHLRASGDVSTIALWGRSMGAATAIMYASRDPTISCMILDSSFTVLTRLAEEMVEKGKEQGVNVPNFVVSVALRMIKSSIKSQAGFSIRHLSPISHVNRCFTPAMFVAGEHDDFINKKHSIKLHAKYAGDKNIVIVDGDHNSPRPRFLLQSSCLFLQSCMQLPPSLELVVPLGTNLLAPPWICQATFSKYMAMEKARAEASTSGGRKWLPIDGVAQQQQQLQRQRSQPVASRKSGLPPAAMSIEKGTRTRSTTDASTPTAADYAGVSELPDMSERQKEIQQSLFMMLGQQE